MATSGVTANRNRTGGAGSNTSPGRGSAAGGIVPLIAHLWQVHAPLTIFGLLMVVFTAFFGVGIVADSRVITGAPAWLKPTKFGISIAVYTLTLTWLLGFVRTERRWLQRTLGAIAWLVITVFVIEMAVIVTQVIRGTTSHFNFTTPLDGALYSIMGSSIAVLWGANLVLAAILLFVRFANPAFAWSLRLGLIISVIGMGLGFLMTSPTAQQMASWEAGEPMTIVGAHSVGVADGGPGMPLTGWSSEGGDLRVPHFVGMHALQLIPLLGWLVTRRRRWNERQQSRLVWVGSGGFLAFVGLVTWQALRGQSVIAPDWLTLAVFAAVVGATLLAAVLVLRRGATRARSAGRSGRVGQIG